MQLTRRKALALVGGGTILAAGGATAGFWTTRTPHKALAPWEAAGRYEDVRKHALSYALLAPNAHNIQPWLVSLVGDDDVVIWRDTTRMLPQTDPHHRQLVISMGCFLEQMRIAATTRGVDVALDIYPDGEDGPVARAQFGGKAETDPLFAAIPMRRSCKEPFEDKPLEQAAVDHLQRHATVHTDDAMVSALKELTWQAWMTEAHNPPTHHESVDLMRFGKGEINSNPDGIDLGGPFLEALMMAGVLTREGQRNVDSAGFKQGMAMYQEMLNATPAYVSLTSAGNTRRDQIEAGRQWVRLNLVATGLGVALHPVSQALQEYPKMAEHYATAHRLLAQEGETVQMLGRVGYGPATPRTPRWPLETRLI